MACFLKIPPILFLPLRFVCDCVSGQYDVGYRCVEAGSDSSFIDK